MLTNLKSPRFSRVSLDQSVLSPHVVCHNGVHCITVCKLCASWIILTTLFFFSVSYNYVDRILK